MIGGKMAKSKHLIKAKSEKGYDKICPYCSARWGADINGPRPIDLLQCDSCRAKKLDLKSLEPEPCRNFRSRMRARELALTL